IASEAGRRSCGRTSQGAPLNRPETHLKRPNRMRLRSGLLLLCLFVGATAAAPCAQQPDGAVERVRAALARPASHLALTERPPDFTVHIEERRPLQDIFDVPPWASPTLVFGGFTRPALFAPIEG